MLTLSSLLLFCIKIIVATFMVGLTIAIMGFITYMTAGVVASLVQTFKVAQAKNRARMFFRSMNNIAESIKTAPKQK